MKSKLSIRQRIDALVRNTRDHVAYLNSLIVLLTAVVAVVVWVGASLLAPAADDAAPIVQNRATKLNKITTSAAEPKKDYWTNRRAECTAASSDRLPVFFFDGDLPGGCHAWLVDNSRALEARWVERIELESGNLAFFRVNEICDQVAQLDIRPYNARMKDRLDKFCFSRRSSEPISQFVVSALTDNGPSIVSRTFENLRPLPRFGPIIFGENHNCAPFDEERGARTVRAFRLTSVAKAALLGESINAGPTIVDRIRKGTSPLFALFDFPIARIAGAKWEKDEISQNAMEGVAADYLLEQLTDDELTEWANVGWYFLSSDIRSEALSFARELLEFYDSKVRARRLSIRSLSADYAGERLRSGYQHFRRLPIFYDYMLLDGSAGCVDNQLGRFWLRRLRRGTDTRTYGLLDRWVREHKD